MARRPIVATYSIAACDLETKQWGVAVQSKFLSVGSVVPWAEPEVGRDHRRRRRGPRSTRPEQAWRFSREGLSGGRGRRAGSPRTPTRRHNNRASLGVVDGEGAASLDRVW